MTIYLFDFDDTITRLPYEDSLTYMMKEESLDPSFDFKLIKRTKKGYQDAVQKNIVASSTSFASKKFLV